MFAETFYQAAQSDPRLCMIVADISPAGAIDKFRTTFPDRFVNTGVAEQIMIGMCAGMALRGLGADENLTVRKSNHICRAAYVKKSSV